MASLDSSHDVRDTIKPASASTRFSHLRVTPFVMFQWTGVFFVACCLSIGSRTFETGNSEKERLWLDLLNVWRSDGRFNDNRDSSDLFSEEFFDDSGGGRRERFVWEETPSVNGTAEDPPTGSSLVFVFDSTGSMKSELLQVKIGAAKILDALRVRPDVPIRNYIMIPFKDPGKFPGLLQSPRNPCEICSYPRN